MQDVRRHPFVIPEPGLLDHLLPYCCEPVVQRLGAWRFVPVPSCDGCRDLVYHRDEPLPDTSGEPPVAERLARLVGRAVTILVRGRIVHADDPPLELRGWHLAIRDEASAGELPPDRGHD